ncbi:MULTISPECIES: hypothetical protein [unclassified Microcoleus]
MPKKQSSYFKLFKIPQADRLPTGEFSDVLVAPGPVPQVGRTTGFQVR